MNLSDLKEVWKDATALLIEDCLTYPVGLDAPIIALNSFFGDLEACCGEPLAVSEDYARENMTHNLVTGHVEVHHPLYPDLSDDPDAYFDFVIINLVEAKPPSPPKPQAVARFVSQDTCLLPLAPQEGYDVVETVRIELDTNITFEEVYNKLWGTFGSYCKGTDALDNLFQVTEPDWANHSEDPDHPRMIHEDRSANIGPVAKAYPQYLWYQLETLKCDYK